MITPADDEQAHHQLENVTQALAIVAPLLRVITTPDNEVGYTLTHHTLREFITDSDRCREMKEPIGTARTTLAKSSANRALLDSPARMYTLRNAVTHLIEQEYWDDSEKLLTDIFFLDAKAEAGLAFELVRDFRRTAEAVPQDHSFSRLATLLEEALRRDVHFIARHSKDYPQALFQSLWNSCWWYDSPEAKKHFHESSITREPHASDYDGPKLHEILERWLTEKSSLQPGFIWLRNLRPPRNPLDDGLIASLNAYSGRIAQPGGSQRKGPHLFIWE